jgi:undecaprenyl-diphosphatase
MKTSLLQQKQSKKMIVCVVFLVSFIMFSVFKSSFQSIDSTINLWTVTIHTDTWTLIAKGFHYAFDTMIITIAALVVAGVLLIKGRKTRSLLLVAAVGGNALFVAAIKTIAQVARPENQLLPDASFAYPSGHCAGVTIFIGLLTYYAWLKWGSSQHAKLLFVTIFGLVTACVGFDRIYLNIHWLSDVIGGFLFGAFWLSFCIIFYERLKIDSVAEA